MVSPGRLLFACKNKESHGDAVSKKTLQTVPLPGLCGLSEQARGSACGSAARRRRAIGVHWVSGQSGCAPDAVSKSQGYSALLETGDVDTRYGHYGETSD